MVHVVWRTNSQNITDQQILSQIDVLNEDFGHRNADTSSILKANWRSISSASNFQFCMAQIDRMAIPTNGIERRQTNVNTFTDDDLVKAYTSGGMDAWDTRSYFNIWVCNLGGGILGFMPEFPTSQQSSTYGVVIGYDAFGRRVVFILITRAELQHMKSVTALIWKHIWGDDQVLAPVQTMLPIHQIRGAETYGCLTYPANDNCNTTTNGYMFMNYMDYSDDRCLYMFTNGQNTRMNTAMTTWYSDLLANTNNLWESGVGVSSAPDDFQFSLYPNPTEGLLTLDMTGNP